MGIIRKIRWLRKGLSEILSPEKWKQGLEMSGSAEAGFCGDYCGKCPNYPEKCRGCVASDHMDCYFVKCCIDRGIEHCGFCPDLLCKKLNDFCPDDRLECPPGYHIENLRVRRVVGTEAWLKTQREKWNKERKRGR